MRAAVWREGATELLLEDMPDPDMIPGSVIVEVMAAFVPGGYRDRIKDPGSYNLPPRPFVPGIDTVGCVLATADQVSHVAPGDLVYCDHGFGACVPGGIDDRCILGSFGLGPDSAPHLDRWRNGNLAEKMILPAACMVPLGAVAGVASAAQLARLGWYGTAYGGFLKTAMQPGETAIVSGASGQVGSVGVLMALALGARRVVATGRREALLDELTALAPDRVVPVVLGNDDDAAAIRDAAGGGGADVMVDCIGYGAGPEATMAGLAALGIGGRAALVGSGFTAPLSLAYEELLFRELTIMGSIWFPRWAGHRMVAMIASGQLDIGPVEPIVYPLEDVHDALECAARGGLGLRHVVVAPNTP